MSRKYYVILGVILFCSLLSLLVYYSMYHISSEPGEDDMQYYNYTDLEITSAVTPLNAHMLIETDDGYLYLFDNSVPSKVYKSIDKGENWGDNDPDYDDGDALITRSSSREIKSLWHDRTNDYIYFVEVDETLDDGTAYAGYIKLSDDSVTMLGGAIDDGQQTRVPDIWLRDSNVEVLLDDAFATNIYRWNDPNWDLKDDINLGSELESYVIVKDADEVYFYTDTVGSMQMVKYDGNVTLTGLDDIAGYSPPTQNQRGIAYDGSGILYFIFNKDADSKDYLMSYTIATDTIAELMEFNVVLMLDRNTVSGVKEKAYHLTSYNIYQLHPVLPYQLHFISKVNSDAVFIAITDNFLMNSDGDMFEYENCSKYVIECSITRKDMKVPEASMDLMNKVPLEKGMHIVVKDTFTTATATSTATIFEGYVDSFSDRLQQVAVLISPAIELRNIRPSGEYSGRSDQIISSLISDYCKYVTAGTLSEGGAMGDIDFYGDKTMEDILNDLALFDNFTWYLTPTGALYYNDGTVDTGEDFTSTSRIFNVKKHYIMRAVNYVKIKGAYISGTQVASDAYEDETDQEINGINPFERTHSHLDTAALCNTTASNILTRFGTQPEVVEFDHHDGSVGLMQEAQTITVTYTGPDLSISETQYGIREVIYDAVRGRGHYRVSDRII